MNIIFITRCYKPTNLQAIKDNLKEVFQKQSKHTYVQYLLVDMSYNQPEDSFKCFEDEHTKVLFVYNKKDYYNNFAVDQLIQNLVESQNSWVYVLDDDNLINSNFLIALDYQQNADVLVINSNQFSYKVPLPLGKIVGYIDTSSYIVKLNVRKEVPVYVEGESSYAADGKFFENLMKKQYKIKYINILALTKSALKRPLNVLRKDV